MKFFHLSDLHIGLKLIERDLREDQEYIFEQIIRLAKEQQPDAMVIAGDIYDKAVPSAEAVEIFDSFMKNLSEEMPQMPVEMYDERFTSVIAHRAMLDGGMKKTARRDKAIVDEISATIILNDFLESRR